MKLRKVRGEETYRLIDDEGVTLAVIEPRPREAPRESSCKGQIKISGFPGDYFKVVPIGVRHIWVEVHSD